MEPVESESAGSAARMLAVGGPIEMRSTYIHSHIQTHTIFGRKHEMKIPLRNIGMDGVINGSERNWGIHWVNMASNRAQ
jgi:hypothetical protein